MSSSKFRDRFYGVLQFLAISLSLGGLLLSPQLVLGQSTTINGVVTDANSGETLPGVNILVKGTTTGTSTDAEGNFELTVPSLQDTLVVSFIGFETKEVSINGRKKLDISLPQQTITGEEMVVVGYGEQKKVNLTGSVSEIQFDDIKNIPASNTANLLQGRLSGVTVTSGGAQPGRNDPNIRIRGIGTFGNSEPMVLIDGVEGSLNQISPENIKSVSVLKDAASAAIYGVKAANGVILVTTKRGNNEGLSLNYSSSVTLQEATVLPNYVNSWNWAQLYNETQGQEIYTSEMIQKMKNGSDPDHFANTNWLGEVFKTAPMHNHNLSVSGGTDKAQYRASLEYLNQDGIMINTNTKRINFRSNVDFKINDHINVGLNLAGNRRRINEPPGGTGGGAGIMRKFFWFTRPTVPLKYSSGNWGVVDGNPEVVPIHNPVQWAKAGNRYSNIYGFNGQVFSSISFLNNFEFETKFAGNYDNSASSTFDPLLTWYDAEGNIRQQDTQNSLNEFNRTAYMYLNENILTYKNNIGNHNFDVLVGQSTQYNRYDQSNAYIENFPNNQLYQLDAGVNNPAVGGTAAEVSLQSFFGRLKYDYNSKYLLEFNLRRDGSSRMPEKNRYGNFPSFSVGWRISEEKFMANYKFISNLKLRGSWGKLGNQEIGNYAYNQLISLGENYLVGGDLTPGAAVTSLANSKIKWETTRSTNIGVDLALFSDKLNFSADYFDKTTSDILIRLPINLSLGWVQAPYQNAGKVQNKGLEFSLSYTNAVGALRYNIGGNISHVKNEILDTNGLEWLTGRGINRVGSPIGAYYGYEFQGIYQNQREIDSGPQRFNGVAGPGDIIYPDISGPNGQPDGKIDANDRTIIGDPFPDFNYGFNASANYSNFDLTLFFQGVAGVDRFNYEPIGGNGNMTERWLGRWTEEQPSESMPRLDGVANQLTSEFWLMDASYLRLKNLEFGYNLSSELLQDIGLTNARIYFVGTNLVTFSKVDNWDPEKFAGDGQNYAYPQTKTYSLGINLSF